MNIFTEKNPCRCGFDGTGTHRCHAGRPDPNRTGEDGSRWCPNPGVEKFIPSERAALSGTQMKFSCTTACYCEQHWKEVNGS